MKLPKSFKYIVALVVIAWLGLLVDFEKLWVAFSNLTLPLIVILILISFILVYVSAVKWGLFLKAESNSVSIVKLFNLYLMGYFVNSIFPSYIGGDAARSWYAGKLSTQHSAFAATFLERFTGLIAMILMAFVALFFVSGLPDSISLVVAALCFGLVISLILIFNNLLVSICRKLPIINKKVSHVIKIQNVIQSALKNKTLLVNSLLLSFIFFAIAVVNVAVSAYAVGWVDVPVNDLIVVLPLILLIGAIPITPSGIGLQEGAYYYFLTMIGSTPEQAIGVALVLRAKFYILAIFGAVVWLLNKKNKNLPSS